MLTPKIESLLTQAAREARALYPNAVAREGGDWLHTLLLAADLLAAEGTEATAETHVPATATAETPLERYAARRDAIGKMMEDVRAGAKDVFVECFQELFARFPGLESVRWTQYTDYFNDGDPCNFHAHIWNFEINDWDAGYEEWPYYLKNQEKFNLQPSGGFETLEQETEAANAVAEFLQTFDQDDYEEIFGDHVQVTADRSGITVSDYTRHD